MPCTRKGATVTILSLINALAYIDRFSLSCVLVDVQKYFEIGDGKGGFIISAFLIAYTIFSPIFGYLGDYLSRKYLMVAGIVVWTIVGFLGTYVEHYWVLVATRFVLGIGQTIFATICPTVLMDMFSGAELTKMLTIFYFGIPVGCGLGYLIGGQAAAIGNTWRWSGRATIGLGGLLLILMIIIVRDPARGASEGQAKHAKTKLHQDLRNLFKTKSFTLVVIAFWCVFYAAGAVAWWGPNVLTYATNVYNGETATKLEELTLLLFGGISIAAGFLGPLFGFLVSIYFKKKIGYADPLICAVGMLISAPALLTACYIIHIEQISGYILLFIGMLGLSVNWALGTEICLLVVVPDRRSFADGVMMFFAHLGDILSPYLVGRISDWARKNDEFENAVNSSLSEAESHFRSLRVGLYTAWSFEVLAGAFFLWMIFYFEKDRQIVADTIAGINSRISDVN